MLTASPDLAQHHQFGYAVAVWNFAFNPKNMHRLHAAEGGLLTLLDICIYYIPRCLAISVGKYRQIWICTLHGSLLNLA
jgi:hypothetical protein